MVIAPLLANAQTAEAPRPRADSSPNILDLTDEAGRRVRVAQPVQRVVSLAPALTETMFALGAGDRLAGTTDYCDYPAEALGKPKVGGAINPSLEQIVALRPDVVLMTKTLNRRETFLSLENLGMVIYATDPRTVDDVVASLPRLGELVGRRDAGTRLATDLRQRLDSLKQRLASLPQRRALFIVGIDPLITIGRKTFIADALRWAGAESVISAQQDWPQISLEEIVRLQPEVIVFASSREESAMREFEKLTELPGWRGLDAIRNRRVIVVSEVIDRPSPRLIDAIEDLARHLHPQAFEMAPKPGNPRAKHSPPDWLERTTSLTHATTPGACFACAD